MATPPVKVHIKTTADTKGAKQTTRALDQVKRSATQSGGQGAAAIAGLAGKLGGLVSIGGAATFAIGQIRKGIAELVDAVNLLKVQELSEIDIASALANAGELTDEYLAKLHQLASAHQDLTGVGDETWLQMFAQLTRFGMSSKNVDQVSDALLNLTALLDGNVTSAAMLLQRALEGQFEMFTRYGIKINRTGDDTKDLANLFEMLADKAGGKLEARLGSLSVAADRNTAAWGDMKEVIADVYGLDSLAKRWHQLWTDYAKGTIIVLNDLGLEFGTLEDKTHGINNISLDNAIDQAEKLAGTYKDVTKAADATLRRLDEIAAAKADLKKAEIDRMVAAGEISPNEGRRRQAELTAASGSQSIARRSGSIAERLAQVEGREKSGQLTPDQAAAERADLEHQRSVLDIRSQTVGVRRSGALSGVSRSEKTAADRARLAGLQGDLSGAEDSLENLGSSPEAAAAIAEAGEASSARGALSRLEGSHQVDGRRMSTRSRGYRDELSRLHKQAADEQREADEALHQLGQLKGSLTQTIGQIKQEIETLNSQMRNAQ